MKKMIALLLTFPVFLCTSCGQPDETLLQKLSGTWDMQDGHYMYFEESLTGATYNTESGKQTPFTYELMEYDDYFMISLTTEGGALLEMKAEWVGDKEMKLDWYGQTESLIHISESKPNL